MSAPYKDRAHAGLVLVRHLQAMCLEAKPLVLAIPNGGVAVAVPLAKALGADLDLIIVRKLQIPYNPEAGFGAVTSLGTVILNQPLVRQIGLSQAEIDRVVQRTQLQISKRQEVYRSVVQSFSPQDRLVLLVDDGLASGYTMLAAVKSVQKFSPQQIIVAVPTASIGAVSLVKPVIDNLICPHTPSGYTFAVADAYQRWYDVPDEEVLQFLRSMS